MRPGGPANTRLNSTTRLARRLALPTIAKPGWEGEAPAELGVQRVSDQDRPAGTETRLPRPVGNLCFRRRGRQSPGVVPDIVPRTAGVTSGSKG